MRGASSSKEPLELADLLAAAPTRAAKDAEKTVPRSPGYYSIFVDAAESLPDPFAARLTQRGTRPLYIGIARRSLFRRLVEQNLVRRTPSQGLARA
jgi:hypothetical protein